MADCWNRDYRQEVIRFLSPVTGPIVAEYLYNEDGSICIEQLDGNPDLITFLDKSKVSRFDFHLYVRTNGRDSASRKKAVDTLMAAANKCEKEIPFPGAKMTLVEFPKLFNRNMSGNEEYRARFALYFRTEGLQEEEA